MVRCTLYILLPISIVVGLFFVWQGVPQNLSAYVNAVGLEGVKQTIAMGPVASQEVIKMLGTNGGGFFNANSAHPFENPNALTNLVQMILIFIWAARSPMCSAAWSAARNRAGRSSPSWACCSWPVSRRSIRQEAPGNPAFAAFHVDQAASALQAGGNMEGKEVRFGIANSALFTTVTTDASCGAVNAMHDSLMPLAGMIPLINISWARSSSAASAPVFTACCCSPSSRYSSPA